LAGKGLKAREQKGKKSILKSLKKKGGIKRKLYESWLCASAWKKKGGNPTEEMGLRR